MDLLAPRVQPDVPEQHQGHAKGLDLSPTHKSSFLEQPVDHFLLIQQVVDFRQTRPSQKVFSRNAPTSPTTGADGFYRLPKQCLKKMATGKESTALPLTLCRWGQQPGLLPREWEPWLLGYYQIIQALWYAENPYPTHLWNRKLLGLQEQD